MRLDALPLHGRFVRLEPLAEAHKADLRAACEADPEIWEIFPYSMAGEHFDPWWTRTIVSPERDWNLFAVMFEERCVGVTGYVPEAAPGVVVIGGTYYRPEARGGPVNPEAKRLLLQHAFSAGARRVVLNVDVVNARSRAAMLKLGAVQEGIARQQSVTWTGRARDVVVFSILADEWRDVRARLDQRLAAFA